MLVQTIYQLDGIQQNQITILKGTHTLRNSKKQYPKSEKFRRRSHPARTPVTEKRQTSTFRWAFHLTVRRGSQNMEMLLTLKWKIKSFGMWATALKRKGDCAWFACPSLHPSMFGQNRGIRFVHSKENIEIMNRQWYKRIILIVAHDNKIK